MRTRNFVLIASIFITAMVASSAEAQRVQRQLFNSTQVFQRNALAWSHTEFATAPSAYSTNSERYPYVIARPEDRQWIRETPIEMRPNRPMHFWGNSRRRTFR